MERWTISKIGQMSDLSTIWQPELDCFGLPIRRNGVSMKINMLASKHFVFSIKSTLVDLLYLILL